MSDAPEIAGLKVLVVEDDYFMAEELCRALRKHGAQVVGPVPRVDQAMDLLAAKQEVDAAVLDVNLTDGMSYPIADALQARNVPFVWATGYDHGTIPARFARVRRCEKPVDLSAVVTALRR